MVSIILKRVRKDFLGFLVKILPKNITASFSTSATDK